MPYIARIQSLVNHSDACSTGNKQAGLVNTMDFPRIPSTILKSNTATFLLSATNGNKITNCCSGTCDSTICPGCNNRN
jgi:hypothetical protein